MNPEEQAQAEAQDAQRQQTSVDDFLKENVEQVENKKFTLSRFKAPFEIKPITNDRMEALRKQCTKATKDRRTQQIQKIVDQDKLTDAMVVEAVVVPDLNNDKLQQSYCTIADPAGTAKAMLLAGEYADLLNEIQEVSGFETSIEDDVDEAKK